MLRPDALAGPDSVHVARFPNADRYGNYCGACRARAREASCPSCRLPTCPPRLPRHWSADLPGASPLPGFIVHPRYLNRR